MGKLAFSWWRSANISLDFFSSTSPLTFSFVWEAKILTFESDNGWLPLWFSSVGKNYRGLQFSLYCVRLSASPKGVINNDNNLPRTPGDAQC